MFTKYNNICIGIPEVVWKCLGEEGIDMLWNLMQGIYEQETIPTEWRDSVIIPVYKQKGDIQDCGHYRGIKLMSHRPYYDDLGTDH